MLLLPIQVEEVLTRSSIYPKSRITIFRKHNNQWIPTEVNNIIDYSFSSDRRFGASTCNLSASNPNGVYTYSRDTDENRITIGEDSIISPLFYWGNIIKVEEGIYDNKTKETAWYDRFLGFITAVAPSNRGSASGKDIKIEAYDFMKLLLDDVFEKPKYGDPSDNPIEPQKIWEEKVELIKVGLDDPDITIGNDELNYVYKVPDVDLENYTVTNIEGDKKYRNWAQFPAPHIFVNNKRQEAEYEIDYARGVVYFGKKKKDTDVITASFYRYNMDTNRFEDVIAYIIKDAYRRAFGWLIDDWIVVDANGVETTLEALYAYNPDNPQFSDKTVEWVYAPNGVKSDFRIVLAMSDPRATIPRTVYSIDNKKSHFDVVKDMLKYVNPSYRIYAGADGCFYGRYQMQKSTPDVEIILKKSIEIPVSSNNIYTRVVSLGKSNTSTNIAINEVESITVTGQGWSFNRSALDDTKALIDANVNTRFVKYFKESDPRKCPIDHIVFKLKKPIYLGRLDILFAPGFTLSTSGNTADLNNPIAATGMKLTVDVSPNGTDWYSLDKSGTIRVGSTSEWLSIGESEFDEIAKQIMIQYIRVNGVEASEPFSGKWFGYPIKVWGLSEVQIWPSDIIRKEVDVFDIVDPDATEGKFPKMGFIRQEFADEVYQRLGWRTLVLPLNEGLTNDEMVENNAKGFLFETVRHLNTARVEIVYSPHLQVGMTALLTDPILNLSALYFIETISVSNSGNHPSVMLELTSWN